jgi:fructose 1,6-bisphosphatase
MDVEAEIKSIKERNARVEADKAWETSTERRALIAAGIYALSAIFLLAINAQNPYLAALVPALGFVLSTLTLPFIKEGWVRGRGG